MSYSYSCDYTTSTSVTTQQIYLYQVMATNATTTTGNIQYCVTPTQLNTFGTGLGNLQNCGYYPDYQYQYQYQYQYAVAPAYDDKASKKAEELLLLCLNDEQKKQYLELGYFETSVNDKIYRIRKGTSGNVKLLEKGKEKYSYCIHPSSFTPSQDAMLAQLLMLQTDEARFLTLANRTVLM